MHWTKPFKGVITDWHKLENSAGTECVYGIAAWHADEQPLAIRAADDPIVRGLPIQTSRVVQLLDQGTFSLLETRNSMYILINEQRI